MDAVMQWVSNHAGTLLIVYAVFSNVMAALPTPNMSDPNKSPQWYIILWDIGHFIALNIPRVFPQLRVAGKDKP